MAFILVNEVKPRTSLINTLHTQTLPFSYQSNETGSMDPKSTYSVIEHQIICNIECSLHMCTMDLRRTALQTAMLIHLRSQHQQIIHPNPFTKKSIFPGVCGFRIWLLRQDMTWLRVFPPSLIWAKKHGDRKGGNKH